jgi:hypothetical protein
VNDNADPLHFCKRCRWSVAHSAGNLEPLLWCRLREGIARGMCPGYERYPGCEGDDD